MFKVIQELTVKVNGTIKTFQVGSIVKLPIQAAQMFIEQGKLEPVVEPAEPMSLNERMAIMGENTEPGQTQPHVTDFGVLVIPWNSDKKYHYWNGGTSVGDTLRELGRCDLISKYKSLYSDN
jgi:hypothetical protein